MLVKEIEFIDRDSAYSLQLYFDALKFTDFVTIHNVATPCRKLFVDNELVCGFKIVLTIFLKIN